MLVHCDALFAHEAHADGNNMCPMATNKDIDETIEQGLWKHDIKQGLFKIVYSNGSQFCVNYVDGHVNGAPRGGKCTECPTLDEKKACVCL